MNRPRNNFAIPKGGTVLHGVLTFQDIRDLRPQLGPLNARMGRYLRRFTLPVSEGSGPSRKVYVKLPDTELARAPEALQNALRPYLTEDYEGLVSQHPFIEAEPDDQDAVNADLDQEIGSELGPDEQPFSWEAHEGGGNPNV